MVLKRTAAVGAILTGFLGWVLTINAMMSSDEMAAGVILAASALAFGFAVFGASSRGEK